MGERNIILQRKRKLPKKHRLSFLQIFRSLIILSTYSEQRGIYNNHQGTACS